MNPVPGDVCEEETVCMGGVDDDGGGHAPDAGTEAQVLGLDLADDVSMKRLRDFNEDRRPKCSLAGELKFENILYKKCVGKMKNSEKHAELTAELNQEL